MANGDDCSNRSSALAGVTLLDAIVWSLGVEALHLLTSLAAVKGLKHMSASDRNKCKFYLTPLLM